MDRPVVGINFLHCKGNVMKLTLAGWITAAGLSFASCLQVAAAADAPLTKITVGVIPIIDTAPLYLGVKQGFFKEEGLDVVIESGVGGAALVPGVQSGSYEFAFSNLVSLMIARDKGLDLKVVTNGVSTTGSRTNDYAGVVVRADSPITNAAGLSGKRVSSNTLGNIADTAIRAAVDKAGGNSSTIKFTELSFPNAAAALDNKQVDAVYLLEPFLSSARANGGRVVSYLYADMNPKMDISGYFTTGAMVKSRPDLVKKFQAAMNKSLKYSQAHSAEVRAIVATYTKIPKEVLDKIVLPEWRVEMNRDAMKQLGAAAFKYGAVSAEPALGALLP
jgi:NitT/TauT family transport system substrate-binding protein